MKKYIERFIRSDNRFIDPILFEVEGDVHRGEIYLHGVSKLFKAWELDLLEQSIGRVGIAIERYQSDNCSSMTVFDGNESIFSICANEDDATITVDVKRALNEVELYQLEMLLAFDEHWPTATAYSDNTPPQYRLYKRSSELLGGTPALSILSAYLAETANDLISATWKDYYYLVQTARKLTAQEQEFAELRDI